MFFATATDKNGRSLEKNREKEREIKVRHGEMRD